MAAARARRIPAMPGLVGSCSRSTGTGRTTHRLSAGRYRPHRQRRCRGAGRSPGFRGRCRRCDSSFDSTRRICRTAGKPRRAGTLLCRSALPGRGSRLAVLRRGASGLSALLHGDMRLFSRRNAAVRAALVDPLGRNSGEAGRLSRRFPCRAGGSAMIRGCIRSGLPGSCRAGTHIDSTHKAVRPRYAAWHRVGPLPRCPLPGVAGLGRGCSCHAGTSGTGDMGDTPVRSGGDEGFPRGTTLVGRRALCNAVHTAHRGVSSRILLPGVRVLSAKLRRSTLGDSGVRGISRRLGSGASLCGAGLLPSWRIRSDGPVHCPRRARKACPPKYRTWPGSIRAAARRRCTAAVSLAAGIPARGSGDLPAYSPHDGIGQRTRQTAAAQTVPGNGRIQTNAGDDGVNLFRHLDDAEH